MERRGTCSKRAAQRRAISQMRPSHFAFFPNCVNNPRGSHSCQASIPCVRRRSIANIHRPLTSNQQPQTTASLGSQLGAYSLPAARHVRPHAFCTSLHATGPTLLAARICCFPDSVITSTWGQTPSAACHLPAVHMIPPSLLYRLAISNPRISKSHLPAPAS